MYKLKKKCLAEKIKEQTNGNIAGSYLAVKKKQTKAIDNVVKVFPNSKCSFNPFICY